MADATTFRNKLTSTINENGSTVVIIPKTKTVGSYGGYEEVTDTEGTSVSTLGLPSSSLIQRGGEPFGKLKEGECTIVLKYDEIVEKDYEVTWKEDNYKVQEIKKVRMQDTIIGIRVKLSRNID